MEHVQHIGTASGIFSATWLLIALPLFGALILLVGGKRTDTWGHLLGCATVLGSFVIGAVQFLEMLGAGRRRTARSASISTTG